MRARRGMQPRLREYRALRVLDAYDPDAARDDALMTDLLSDLRVACERLGIDFAACCRSAEREPALAAALCGEEWGS